jgi:hypothetical protein
MFIYQIIKHTKVENKDIQSYLTDGMEEIMDFSTKKDAQNYIDNILKSLNEEKNTIKYEIHETRRKR